MSMNVKVSGYRLEHGLVWPKNDIDCAKFIFEQTDSIDLVLTHCKSKRAVVQAGGNCGLWPIILSKKFDVVYTFEPDDTNFKALVLNTLDQKNIIRFQTALGFHRDQISLNIKEKNVGAHHVKGRGIIPTIRVDDLALKNCDLIYLDVEGAEMATLLGSQKTIQRNWPVIVIEEKGLSNKYGYPRGSCEEYLIKLGYTVVERSHKDIVFVK